MSGALDIFRPFAWLALAAFLVGFLSYVALGQPSQSFAHETVMPATPASSGPISDEWNVTKHI